MPYCLQPSGAAEVLKKTALTRSISRLTPLDTLTKLAGYSPISPSSFTQLFFLLTRESNSHQRIYSNRDDYQARSFKINKII